MLTPRQIAHAACFLAFLLVVVLVPRTPHAQQPEAESILLTGIENLEIMVILLKLEDNNKRMSPLQEELTRLQTEQQLLIRQMNAFENKAITDRSLPRAEWFFSSRPPYTLRKVNPPVPRPVR